MEPRVLKIAAIEDDAVDQLILRRLLDAIPEWRVELTGYDEPTGALQQLAQDPPDLIFLDHELGTCDGVQFLQELRQAGVDSPVILLTGTSERNIAVQAMQAGAADYISKHALSVNCLRRAVSTALAQSELERRLRTQREELEHTNQELTRRNSEIRGFHHMLSHELRSPAGAALTAADLLLDGTLGSLNDEQREFVTIIESSCQQILVQIQDLLDISRLETGKLALRPRNVDLAKLAERAVTVLIPTAQSQAIVIEFLAARDLPDLAIDQERIGQVLNNLLNNALKFTPPEGKIRVTVGRDPNDADSVRVAVQDTGRGIPPEHLPRLFERLYQVSRSDSQEKGGLGLGLSLCRDLVGLHGGRIGVDSAPDQGSTFWFLLPIAGVPAAELVPQGTRAHVPA
jgi:signal transduction histidine kinase